jgi:hypothetical protein
MSKLFLSLMMTKNDCKFNLEWNYSEWRETELGSSIYMQRDWNQTLITKINQISANINKETLRGGANRILTTKKILPLIESFEFYFNGVLSGRYVVDIDDSFKFGKVNNIASEDVIYVYSNEAEQNRILIPRIRTIPNGMDEVSFQFPDNEEEFYEHKMNYYGSITILNYEKNY